MLLNKEVPTRVISRMTVPLVSPSDENREGHMPNVVYTCGAMALGQRLFTPYGVADPSITFCSADIGELPSKLV